jgi:cytochrome c oxidase assembly factor 5
MYSGDALALCLASSDCVLAGNKPSDCIRLPLSETLPTNCQQLKKGYGDCKRGMVDMRKRFRGNKPVATSTELEGSGGSGQLYADIGEKKSPPKVVEPEEER